ncbi:MAG: TerB family tellurite resistance protein [Bacteroidetes bacterium]|nr:TerB family tellurite resistance protein [Bacteroidota bacterium]
MKFYSYINIIKVDGARKDEEIHLFDTLISNSLLDEHLKAGLIEKLNADHMEKVDYSLFLNNPEQSVELLKNLVLIATCDGELHISEKLFIKSIGNQFGFEDNDLEQLINETRPGS